MYYIMCLEWLDTAGWEERVKAYKNIKLLVVVIVSTSATKV